MVLRKTDSMRVVVLLLTLWLAGISASAGPQATAGGAPAERDPQAAAPAPGRRVPAPAPRLPAAAPATAPRVPAEKVEKRVGQATSIRVELQLTDRNDVKVIAEEKLNALLADLELARVRRRNGGTAGQSATGGAAAHRAFEIDLTPEIVGEKIKVTMMLSYMAPAGAAGDDDKVAVALSENLTAFLENGKPTTLIESTGDHGTARRVLVQATATIVR